MKLKSFSISIAFHGQLIILDFHRVTLMLISVASILEEFNTAELLIILNTRISVYIVIFAQ